MAKMMELIRRYLLN